LVAERGDDLVSPLPKKLEIGEVVEVGHRSVDAREPTVGGGVVGEITPGTLQKEGRSGVLGIGLQELKDAIRLKDRVLGPRPGQGGFDRFSFDGEEIKGLAMDTAVGFSRDDPFKKLAASCRSSPFRARHRRR
jgi:hypothetical protein